MTPNGCFFGDCLHPVLDLATRKRLAQEAVELLAPYLGLRVVTLEDGAAD